MSDNREVAAAFVGPEGPATVDGGGARGGAQPVVVDGRTRTDLEAPVTRCTSLEWDELWETALFSRAPADEPSVPWAFEGSQAECVTGDEPPEDSWTDELVGVFSAEVVCGEREASGRSEASGMDLHELAEGELDPGDLPDDPDDFEVSVTEAVARFRIYLDAERGLVSRVESVARGVSIGGLVEIDTIRGSAEAWANGRAQSGDQAGDQGAAGEDAAAFNPYNCEVERTAGTCFDRHLFGVHVAGPDGETAYECGPCGDEQAAVEAIDAALGDDGQARLRDPDRQLAQGAANGFQAGIVKPEAERFADLMLNADQLQTTLPTLEVIRFTSPDRQSVGVRSIDEESPRPVPGRQVYQFAGVEAATSYGIQCLLFYDEEANVCTDPPADLAELTVQLEGADGGSLGGGEFALYRDEAGDGVLDSDSDELVHDGACVTDAEGVCTFDKLLPGAYLLEQTAAPEGYAPVSEPFAVTLAPGVEQTITFTNVADVATVDVELLDLDGAPIAGAEFALYPDVDGTGELPEGVVTAGEHVRALSDGRQNVSAETPGGDDASMAVAASGDASPALEPMATCVTDADGRCAMTVPPGAYILVQTHAPEGFEPIEPIPFELAQAGQTAEVSITNVDALGEDSDAAPEPAPDLRVEDPPPAALPVIDDTPSVAQPAPSRETAQPALPEGFGGTIVRVLRAPGALARLAVRSPMEAAAFAGVWLIWLSAAWLIYRRHKLVTELLQSATRDRSGGPLPPGEGSGRPGGAGPSSGSSGGGGGLGASSRPPGSRSPHPAPGSVAGPGGPGVSAFAGASAATVTPPRPREVESVEGVVNADGATESGGSAAPAAPLEEAPVPTGGQHRGAETPRALMGAAAQELGLQQALATPPIAGGASGQADQTVIVVVVARDEALAALLYHRLKHHRHCGVGAVVQTLPPLRRAMAEVEPDVLVVDLTLGGDGVGDGDKSGILEALEALHPAARTVGVLPPVPSAESLACAGFLAGLASVLDANEDLGNGNLGYAVRQVAAGKRCYGPTVQSLLVERLARGESAAAAAGGLGSPPPVGQELRVAVATGDTEIAGQVLAELDAATDCEVAGTAASLAELRALAARVEPAVLVVDLSLRNGDLWTQIADIHEPARTVGLIAASRSTRVTAMRGLRHGLASLVAADSDLGAGHLGAIVRSVARGQPADGPTVQAVYRSRLAEEVEQTVAGRQLEVARLFAAGLSRREIAERVGRKESTVKKQLHQAREKLGVTDPSSREALRQRLTDLGVLDDGETDAAPAVEPSKDEPGSAREQS